MTGLNSKCFTFASLALHLVLNAYPNLQRMQCRMRCFFERFLFLSAGWELCQPHRPFVRRLSTVGYCPIFLFFAEKLCSCDPWGTAMEGWLVAEYTVYIFGALKTQSSARIFGEIGTCLQRCRNQRAYVPCSVAKVTPWAGREVVCSDFHCVLETRFKLWLALSGQAVGLDVLCRSLPTELFNNAISSS